MDECRKDRLYVKRRRGCLEPVHLTQQVEELAPTHGFHQKKSVARAFQSWNELVVARLQRKPLACGMQRIGCGLPSMGCAQLVNLERKLLTSRL